MTGQQITTEYLDIVFDGPPSHESGRFVEVESPAGSSVNVGEWIEDGEYWRLRIPTSPVVQPARDGATDEREAALATVLAEAFDASRLPTDRDTYLRLKASLRAQAAAALAWFDAHGARRQGAPTITAEWIARHRFEHYGEDDGYLGQCVLVDDLRAALGVQP